MLRRSLALGLMALGAVLLVASFAYWRYSEALAPQAPGEVAVPESLAGERRTSQVLGVEAVDGITRLHGKAFALVSGAEAVYGGGAATLWVSGAPAAPVAAEQVKAMAAKISEGRSPFTALGARSLGQTQVYELTGMGQQHFYFQAGTLVVWLAADAPMAETALAEVLSFYADAGK